MTIVHKYYLKKCNMYDFLYKKIFRILYLYTNQTNGYTFFFYKNQ